MSDAKPPESTTVADEFYDDAKEIVGTMLIPIRQQRIELERRIAEALARAEGRGERLSL
jgi:hypothetical protein